MREEAEGFDNTPPRYASHEFTAHVQDWQPGNPDWNDGAGKGIIGVLNYIAEQGANSIYFLPMNIGGPRYLGDKANGFPGQDSIHFRLLLAEIVSDALSAQMLSRDIQNAPEDYEDADWDLFYAEYSKLMTSFLPIAHEVQLPAVTT